ncbi:MAG: serine/threonine protein kinase [Rubrivivax sp.]|nr:serine/threonine protein kinase [Rubrivivax sp.]
MRAERPSRRLQPPTPLAVGTMLGEYEVRHVLGQGSFGFVYRVTDAAADIDLAVKEFMPMHWALRIGATDVAARGPAEAEAFAQGLRFFLNEGRLLQQLDHPALIKVHGCWEANGTAYLAMDMCTGRNLHDTLQARWRSPSESALRSLLDTLLGALEHLHGAGLQHRDIAPQNIMIEADGRPLLMDLGAARRVSSARGEAGAVGPRDGYAALEMYSQHQQLKRGPWTDFYALGAILHLMIIGKPPPAASSRHQGDRIGFTLQRRDHRHSLLFLSIIDWLLALQPADRPQSVAELRAALAGESPVPARHQPSRKARWGMQFRRHRHWLWIGLGLLVTLALAAYVYRLWRTGLLPFLLR